MIKKDSLLLRVSNHSYDLTGVGLPRIIKHYFISKVTPLKENFAGGPGWKCLLLLIVLHGLGRVAGWGIFLFGTQAKAIVLQIQKKHSQ